MFFRTVLLLSLFLSAAAFAYSQESTSTQKRAVKVAEIKCDFSDRGPLRLLRLPANAIEKTVDPIYPQEARDAKIEGKVVLSVLVDRIGNVVETCVEDGPSLLVPAAIDAAKQWKFKKNFGFSATSFKKRRYLQTAISITFRLKEGN